MGADPLGFGRADDPLVLIELRRDLRVLGKK